MHALHAYVLCEQHCWQQAYDIIMDENKALRSFQEAEVTEDPLIVLRCGHVLPMTSMDGYLELQHAYGMHGYGQWANPLPLKVNSCYACHMPQLRQDKCHT